MTGQRGSQGVVGTFIGAAGNAPFMSGAAPAGLTPFLAIANSGGGNGPGIGAAGASGFCLVTEYYSA